jgi:hypothetical protein
MTDAEHAAHQATSELRLDNLERSNQEILETLKALEKQLSVYALTIRLFKGSCYIALIVVGLRIGDIGEIWKGIFHGG